MTKKLTIPPKQIVIKKEIKKRNCIRCRKDFDSTGSGNRHCKKCLRELERKGNEQSGIRHYGRTCFQ